MRGYEEQKLFTDWLHSGECVLKRILPHIHSNKYIYKLVIYFQLYNEEYVIF